MNARKSKPLAALVLCCTVCGCSQSSRVNVTGKLTCKGQPVPSTRVAFYPEDGSRRSTAVTDDNGEFTLKYSRTESGVTLGRHTVSLRYEVSAEEELHKVPPKASPQLRAIIARYGDPKTSVLHYEVTRDGEVIDIPLE